MPDTTDPQPRSQINLLTAEAARDLARPGDELRSLVEQSDAEEAHDG